MKYAPAFGFRMGLFSGVPYPYRIRAVIMEKSMLALLALTGLHDMTLVWWNLLDSCTFQALSICPRWSPSGRLDPAWAWNLALAWDLPLESCAWQDL